MRRAKAAFLLAAVLGLASCAPDAQVDEVERAGDGALTVLVGDGPHRQILEYAAEHVSGDLEIRIEDAGEDANRLVADGDADAAYFQHVPGFEGQTEDEGIEGLAILARVHVVPYGLYSRGCSALDEIPHFGSLLVPGGQAPMARSLYLLQHAKLMTLNKEFGGTSFEDLSITEANVVESQRHLTITQADPAQFPEVVDAVDIVIMNPGTARENGFDPDAALLREPAAGNPYANVLIGRSEAADDPRLAVLAHHLESPDVAEYIDGEFGGAVIAANPAESEPEVPEPENAYSGEPEAYEGPQSCEEV